MDNPVIFKPVFWRLLVYRFFPFYIGWVGGQVVYSLGNHQPVKYTLFIDTTLIAFLVALISVFFTKKSFEIIIDQDKISGVRMGWGTETFLTRDLDFSFRGKQSFGEKISLFHTIRSTTGKKIMVMDFIYGRPITDEIYKVVEQNQRQ